MMDKMSLRRYDAVTVEHILRFTSERYLDAETSRLIAVGKHESTLVMIPYEQDESTITPVTIHATTRRQINVRIQTGRLTP